MKRHHCAVTLVATSFAAYCLAGAAIAAQADKIALEILEPAERAQVVKDFPVSVGLVFPEGELTAGTVGAVVDDRGEKVPFDSEVTGWWSPERRSVKWLLLHFKASADRKYRFERGTARASMEGAALATEKDGAVEVSTGPLQVRLAPGNALVFETASLNGRPILMPSASFFEMADDEGRALSCGGVWKLTLEENTPLRATVRADGVMRMAGDGQGLLARLSIRYQFFKGESFARMYHTFTWMQKSLDPGANRISIRLRPQVGERGKIRVGLAEYGDSAKEADFGARADLTAYQDTAEHYAIRQDGSEIATGRHLGGWIAVEGADGRGVGVSLKDAWQTYPTTLAVRKGDIEIGLWPEEAGRFSFEERDIMPDAFYFHKQWKYYDWTRDGGPTWFNTKDVLPERAMGFFEKLKSQTAAAGKSPGARIAALLQPELRVRIRELTAETRITDGFRARIAHGMNAFLKKRDFYDAESWAGIELRPKAKELLAKGMDKLSDAQVIWLNRLLIESAYPDDLAHSDVPHFIHEYSPTGRDPQASYLHTGEGAARTHEVTVLFYDRSSARSVAEMNSLTQHPFVMRQEPASAVRVPFFGFKMSAVDRAKYPDIERALDQGGCAAFERYPEAFDYGFLRFGMQRSGGPLEGLYRYFTGMQYDQQIIPWMLFLRGGDRRYYEEGMNTAAYAMDIQTNHFNTRGAPTGYMCFGAAMPLPWWAGHRAMNMRVHFLSCCYHITGYQRAQEVMGEAIEGTKAAYRAMPVWGRNRELFAMNMFFAHAYAETYDPYVMELLKEALNQTLTKNYDPQMNVFASPTVYLYDGLIPMYDILKDAKQREAMLAYLHRDGAPDLNGGGLPVMAPLSAYGWAYEQTGDLRYARRLYDQARIYADLAPDHDWSSPKMVFYPMGGIMAYMHRLLPMAVALGMMEQHQLSFPEAPLPYDLFVALASPGSTRKAWVKARKDGRLDLTLTATPETGAAIEVKVFRATGADGDAAPVASAVETPADQVKMVKAQGSASGVTGVFGQRTFKLTIPGAAKGDVFRLEFGGGDSLSGVKVLSDDARIVYEVKPGTVRYSGNAWQYYDGTRVIARMKEDTLSVRRGAAYTIRDAKTREVLARSALLDPMPMQHNLGKGRMIEIVMTAGRDYGWGLEGIEPYVSSRLEDWFAPE